ncbi:HEPN domain-containing protein [Inquilinus sp. KBS0705]|nr:HEPN domain-containing protein [Inquilinus sp. KBS0705]
MRPRQFCRQTFYPRYLNEEEVNDPLTVISDFFSADWLPGHLERLVEWRKYVIEEGYFKNHNDSPASLLYTHQLNARLLEAVYILSQTKKAVSLANAIHINFHEQLQEEERAWLHYPIYLSSLECFNPYLAISNFFRAYSIEEYREFLYEWLETGLSKDAVDESLDVSDIIYFYENMQRLYEAVWIIRQREITPTLKNKADKAEDLPEISQGTKAGIALIKQDCTFNNLLTSAEKHGLSELVKIICAQIASVQLIVYLGTHPSPATFYLLIIIDEGDKTPEHEIVNKIETNCKYLINVCAIVHKSDAFLRTINEGNRFFINALSRINIAYRSAELVIPALRHIGNEVIRVRAEANWARWGSQGKNFLDAALNSIDEGNYGLSVFLMHQAVESALSAIIRVNLDYRIAIHNLARMLRISLIFTDDLREVFDLGSTEDGQLFELLQTAYSAARYKDDFTPDQKLVKELSDKVCLIYKTSEQIYNEVIKNIKE